MWRNDRGWYSAVSAPRRPEEEVVWNEAAYSLMCGLLFSIGNQEISLEDQRCRVDSLLHNVQWHLDYKRLRRELGEKIARLLVLGKRVESDHDLVQRIEHIETNLRGIARELGLRPQDVGVGDAVPTWSEWGVGARLRLAAAAEASLSRAAFLLAAEDRCPPVDQWPVELDEKAYRGGELSCARCSRVGHRRRSCWRAWLGSLTSDQWRDYMIEQYLL